MYTFTYLYDSQRTSADTSRSRITSDTARGSPLIDGTRMALTTLIASITFCWNNQDACGSTIISSTRIALNTCIVATSNFPLILLVVMCVLWLLCVWCTVDRRHTLSLHPLANHTNNTYSFKNRNVCGLPIARGEHF